MITVQNLEVSFGGTTLFEEVGFQVNAGDRIGLIGKNGAGKTTLMKAIYGDISVNEGSISIKKGTRIGVLEQEVQFKGDRTVREEANLAFKEIKQIENKLDKVNLELQERDDYESNSYQGLIQELTELTHRLELIGGYRYEGEAERVLKGLGFKDEDLDKLTSTFSGGWRMRIELAKLLLQNNDVLMLDEPTNHLDIESIMWMEEYLQQFQGAVILVSHDRMFLDRVTNRTIEIVLGRIYDLNKPYTQYQEHREEQRELQRNAQKNQQREIQRAERLINKFRAKSTKAAMAQSLIKKLDKMERIEVDEVDQKVMTIKFPPCPHSGKVVLELDGIGKKFGEKEVLRDITFQVNRKDRIAFVGQNGQGKTTLAKIIVGELDHRGEVKRGYQVKIGYFAQDQADTLSPNLTVHETLLQAADDSSRPRVRDILGAFMFSGDEVEKKVKVLSGGEKNRLALARMLVEPFNVLVMDEPTNHLDMQSKAVLKNALTGFEGTLIVVSHDRDFLRDLADKVYEFKDRQIKEYLGGIEYFLSERQAESFRDIELGEKKSSTSNKKPEKQVDRAKRKALKNSLSKLEKEITDLENDINSLEKEIADSPQDPQIFTHYQEKKEALDNMMKKWETTLKKLDSSA